MYIHTCACTLSTYTSPHTHESQAFIRTEIFAHIHRMRMLKIGSWGLLQYIAV